MKKTIANYFLLFFILISSYASGQQKMSKETVTPENALSSYIETKDVSFDWKLKEVIQMNSVNIYDILLTSQTWKGHAWKHQLTIISPANTPHQTAMLFIDGGSVNAQGEPNWQDPRKNGLVSVLGEMARENQAIVAILKQVPMQPLYGDKREDALISMTLHNYKQDGDLTWPLLFPMTKSAIRAMDAIQAFISQELKNDVQDFVVAGASKRGWTTWLTAASGDKRIRAIAPLVIDIVNMPTNLNYQLETYNEYSREIQDYTTLGIPQAVDSPSGRNIVAMIDPYSYRSKLSMPKMIFNGTNDPYWVVDAVKHYLDSIPGTNLLHYVPNAGHNLGDGKQAFRALSSFFGYTIKNEPYPQTSWTTNVQDGKIQIDVISTAHNLTNVTCWSATSPNRDFRDKQWFSEDLGISQVPSFSKIIQLPANGYKAFYIDLTYQDLNGKNYTQSTRVFVVDPKELK